MAASKAVKVRSTRKKRQPTKPSPTGGKKAKAAPKKSSVKPKSPKENAKITTIDGYLATLLPEQRIVLEALRKTIHKLAKGVEECISYSMPAFRLNGKVVAGFLATRKGFSYFPFSGTTLGTLAHELSGFSQTKSALHFTEKSPLSKALVHKLLSARRAELDH